MGRKLVSFDWALKRLLRSKANFVVLEGFLSELLGGDIRIDELLESESNRDAEAQKGNRLDLKCRDASGRILLVELQHERQDDFLNRVVFGVSRAVTEHLDAGQAYGRLPKVISISLVYFDLGQGNDYIYHGQTRFVGIHTHDELELSDKEKAAYRAESAARVMPEYYLLKVNAFDDVAKDGLDEWMAFLKTQQVPAEPRGKGLREAKKVLDVLELSDEERRAYEAYQDDLHQRASMVDSHYGRGKQEGRKEGRKEGEKRAAQAIARRLLRTGMSAKQVAGVTGLTEAEVKRLTT